VPRPRVLADVQAVAETGRVPIVFGAYDTERTALNRWKLFNAAFLMLPNGELRDRYYKHRLLIFGEYVPLSDRFPRLLDILPTPGQFTPGPGPRIFRVGEVALTPLICYELLFPDVVRGACAAGGEVIVNLTNDYWFGRHLEPYQHLALSRMCALEVARPIVRATNTGVSAIIDHRGRLLQKSGVWTQDVVRGSVPVMGALTTPFARFGAWGTWALAATALVIASVAWALTRDRRPAGSGA
jgi:apolipoprotein N-acyltransferase